MQKILTTSSMVFSTLVKLVVLAVFVFPFLWMISVSLQTTEETYSHPITLVPRIPQFINIADAWSSGPFPMYLRNSIIVTASIIIFQVLIMIPAAYAFAKYEFPGRGLLFSLVIIAFMTPGQITFLPIYQMMASWKLLDTLLPQIIPALTNCFGIFLLRQYFRQVPDELIESAKLDKASELNIIFRIMLPMSKAALSTITLFSFVSHWNDYFWPLVMTNTTRVRPLTVGIQMLRDTEGLTRWNIIMAGNMILVIPILLVYVFASRNIIRAFTYSGIK